MSSVSSSPAHLHSLRDPHKEAQRFIDAAVPHRIIRVCVVTEPGESYVAKVLRQRFPGILLIALRYQNEFFRDTDTLWDAVWRPASGISIGVFLSTHIDEEILPLTVCIPWKASENAWPERARQVWDEIAVFVRLQAQISKTRHYFGPRWLNNMVKNAILVRHPTIFTKTRVPVCIAASGPSLCNVATLLKESSFPIIAVSSALSCLQDQHIIPDAVISSDGGYWALSHLTGLSEQIPMLAPLEASLPSKVLEHNPLAFLDFGSPLEHSLLGIFGYKAHRTTACATVTGVAAQWALDISTGYVYSGGLDLAPSQSFSHCRPHGFDFLVETGQNRLIPAETLHEEKRLANSQIQVYAQWFTSRPKSFTDRFFRIEPPSYAQASLPSLSREAFRTQWDKWPSATLVHSPYHYQTQRKDTVSHFLASASATINDYREGNSLDPLLSEFIKLVSFSGYLSWLKDPGANNHVLTETAGFLQSLTVKAKRYESLYT